jgi:uncharacterized membrane protein
MNRVHNWTVIACFGLGAGQTIVPAQTSPSFQGLGHLPGGTTLLSSATAVSGDGLTVVGVSTSAGGFQGFRWQDFGGMIGLGMTDATAVSFDGSVAVGRSLGPHPQVAARWVEGSGVQLLGSLLPGASVAFGVSANGETVVGISFSASPGPTCNPNLPPPWTTTQAFRWTASSGMVGLGFPIPGPLPASSAKCISNDGAVIGGRATNDSDCANSLDSYAIAWTNGVPAIIGATGVEGAGDVIDVSPDGIALVGSDFNGLFLNINGTHVPFAGLYPAAVSTGGQRVVGSTISGTAAMVWDSGSGARNLREVLINDYGLGAELNGWTLTHANGISDDGSVIAGRGIHNGVTEAWVAIAPIDTDGDSLLDDWEINGIPYTDSSGAQRRYVLSFDGNTTPDCDVNRKDIFVEVDAMTGFAPALATFSAATAAFDAAPIGNPNGAQPGIRLHVILDDTSIPAGNWTADDTNGNGTLDWPTEFDALKLSAASGTALAGYFGSSVERNDPNGAGIREARAKAFRYCIFGRALDPTATTTGPSGMAEIGGNDFFITMGTWPAGGTTGERAGTFMHELGHTLGLRHGGGDDINYKPNYYSVMNYAYQTPKPWMPAGTWPLESGRGGFSRFALLTLNESALNECVAQVGPASALAGTVYVCSYAAGNTLLEWHGRYDVANDWNNSAGSCEDPVAVDINRLPIIFGQPDPPASPNQTLIGHDDWEVIDLNFRDSPCFPAGVHNIGAGEAGAINITFEENHAISAMLPPHCPGDIVSDRDVNVDDLIAVIVNWGACPNGCLPDIAPLPADGQVDVEDLIAVIFAWGACP